MIAEVLKVDPGIDADLSAAQALLKSWDRRTECHNRGGGAGGADGREAAHSDEPTPDVKPIDALRDAITTLKTHFGRLDPEWGQVNRMRRGKFDFADRRRPGHLSRRLWRRSRTTAP